VELIFQRAVRGDTAARDFLDIFNHRLISFVYRIRKKHRIGLGVSSPEEDSAAGHLYSLLGLGFPELKNRLGVNDRALLTHTLTLGNDTRSLEGLVAILRHHFGVGIEAIPLTGSFHAIESSDRTAIGRTGRNRVLGRDAVLGGRFWDQESAFEIRVGPMKLDTFLRFLPSGDALGPLCALVRF
jgi:type VI secretion system protein ImpH